MWQRINPLFPTGLNLLRQCLFQVGRHTKSSSTSMGGGIPAHGVELPIHPFPSTGLKEKIDFNPQIAPCDHFVLEQDAQGGSLGCQNRSSCRKFPVFLISALTKRVLFEDNPSHGPVPRRAQRRSGLSRAPGAPGTPLQAAFHGDIFPGQPQPLPCHTSGQTPEAAATQEIQRPPPPKQAPGDFW